LEDLHGAKRLFETSKIQKKLICLKTTDFGGTKKNNQKRNRTGILRRFCADLN
jgi:hypothetical protein